MSRWRDWLADALGLLGLLLFSGGGVFTVVLLAAAFGLR